MTSKENKEEYKTYLENVEISNASDNDNGDETILTLRSMIDEGDSDEKDVNNDYEDHGTIIMDADGNYYFQTSEKVVKVQPLKESPVKKIPATVVITSNKRKRTEKSSPEPAKKPKLKTDSKIKVKKLDEEIVVKNEEVENPAPEIENQEVYEFDGTESEPGAVGEDDPDYVSKDVKKSTKKNTSQDPASFTCMLCPYETNKKFLLSRHLKTHSDDRPYKCSVCERGFKTSASLMNHRNTHLGLKPHGCTHCDKAFTTSGELTRHVRYRHTHFKPHKCTECDYSSVEMSKLRRHMRCHTGERPYQCPHCTYASPDTFKLKRHMRIHTGEKPYECDICHARFTQSNSLKHHRLIHSVNEKPVFQCHLCPTTCGRKTDLRLHIKKLHNSDQPIPCKRCGKELPDRYSYKMHVKTHEGEKCYRCSFCPYAAISQRHLESHVYIHLDTKPFVCDICQTSFRQKQLLNRHIKVYHCDNYEPPQPRKKDHKCPHCGKLFAFNGNLIRHMEMHDPTSRRAEEIESLKLGRMRRVTTDGSIVTIVDNKQTTLSETDEYIYEETEKHQEENELNEELEFEEEFNEDNIQFVCDELEAEDNYNENNDEHEEGSEEAVKENAIINVKAEKLDKIEIIQPQLKKSANVKAENNEAEIMSLEVEDDQGFMVIEVLPDDDEMEEQEGTQIQLQQKVQSVKTTIVKSENAAETTIIKSYSKESSEVVSGNYFGFEVDGDEEDEETKGAIKLLQLIEQE